MNKTIKIHLIYFILIVLSITITGYTYDKYYVPYPPIRYSFDICGYKHNYQINEIISLKKLIEKRFPGNKSFVDLDSVRSFTVYIYPDRGEKLEFNSEKARMIYSLITDKIFKLSISE